MTYFPKWRESNRFYVLYTAVTRAGCCAGTPGSDAVLMLAADRSGSQWQAGQKGMIVATGRQQRMRRLVVVSAAEQQAHDALICIAPFHSNEPVRQAIDLNPRVTRFSRQFCVTRPCAGRSVG